MSCIWTRTSLGFRSAWVSVSSLNLQGRRRIGSIGHDPLRILFCGTDDYSIACLKALHHEATNANHIVSIDVATRPAKRSGRNLANVKEAPIVQAAHELDLPVHILARDNFSDFELPFSEFGPINLIIASSFGLLIPGSILNQVKWGGLNIHPSFLPDLRGPAPLQHALLQGRKHVGITLQTLHPTLFDKGRILDQTPYPGLAIPKDGECGMEELRELVSKPAAEMLVSGLRQRLYDPVVAADKPFIKPDLTARAPHFTLAPKIRKEDMRVDWATWPADRIIRTGRVLGRVWNDLETTDRGTGEAKHKRILLAGLSLVTDEEYPKWSDAVKAPGTMESWAEESPLTLRLGIWTCDGKLVKVKTITVEGKPPKPALLALSLRTKGIVNLALNGAKLC